MNTRILSTALAFSFAFTLNLNLQSKTIYVRPDANGNGGSWTNALNDLQEALKIAHSGDQIWVSEGLYLPTTKNDRTVSFEIPDGVTLFGGFAGTENTLGERVANQHSTILSGNIGSNDAFDNSYNVVHIRNATSATVLDGLIITGGYADGSGTTSDRRRSGGGLYNEATGRGQSNPTITNCLFVDNFAKDGGAVYNMGKNGDASPNFSDCTFRQNHSDMDGGAVYNDGRGKGNSSPLFTNCQFDTNKGNYGGAVFNYGLNGNAQPQFAQCIFSTNEAYVKGGAVFHLSDGKMDERMFTNSVFNNNLALDHDTDDVHNFQAGGSQMAGN